ncbi:UNVERIFIED_ORG: hypothetical protein GGD59_002261 [Rhizobium esperanzae]
MTFDNSYKPNRENLTPEIAALMDRAFYRNRANGFNVQFVNERGQADEWSFNCRERAEAFAANLARHGTESVFSA